MKKPHKAFVYVVIFLLVAIVSVVVYSFYTGRLDLDTLFGREKEETQEDNTKLENNAVFDTATLDLGDGKNLEVKLQNSECDDTGFEMTQSDSQMTKWKDNNNMYCSSWYELAYYLSEQAMTDAYSQGATYPLESTTVEGVEYSYISRTDGESDGEYGLGIVYKWLPNVDVKGYEASQILRYFNSGQSGEYTSDSFSTALCVFDLNKIDENEFGYLVFGGAASIGSDINYCDVLNNMGVFSIDVK